jgi:hypothetical protein
MIKGFISYSHEDHAACRNLRTHLASLERALGLKFWHDRRVNAGSYWSKEIEQAICNADIFLFLVTPAFFDSQYIMETELKAISKKFDPQSHLSIPILAKDCLWDWAFSAFQAVPVNGNGALVPVERWRPKDKGWNEVNRQLYRAIDSHFGLSGQTVDPWGLP